MAWFPMDVKLKTIKLYTASATGVSTSTNTNFTVPTSFPAGLIRAMKVTITINTVNSLSVNSLVVEYGTQSASKRIADISSPVTLDVYYQNLNWFIDANPTIIVRVESLSDANITVDVTIYAVIEEL
jgi:hypothetical protein